MHGEVAERHKVRWIFTDYLGTNVICCTKQRRENDLVDEEMQGAIQTRVWPVFLNFAAPSSVNRLFE